MREGKQGLDQSTVFGEVQIILGEKRTALATLRTGIAVFALPLSVLSRLVATSRYYEPGRVLHFLLPLLVLSGVLALLGAYLIVHSLIRIRHQCRLIANLKSQPDFLLPHTQVVDLQVCFFSSLATGSRCPAWRL
jgi:uncharacterized membrane protein YidH (DUF202 family)